MSADKITLAELFSMAVKKAEDRFDSYMLEREIKWTRRHLNLIDREISGKLAAKNAMQAHLMLLLRERK